MPTSATLPIALQPPGGVVVVALFRHENHRFQPTDVEVPDLFNAFVEQLWREREREGRTEQQPKHVVQW